MKQPPMIIDPRHTTPLVAGQPPPLAASVRAGVLERRELLRRILHMAPGLLPFIFWAVPHHEPISWLARGVFVGIAVLLGASFRWTHTHIARNGERDLRLAVVGYAASVVGMLVIFPAEPELGMTVLAILAFGDGTATLGGLLFGRRTLPWNEHKTWAGSITFLACAVPAACFTYWGTARPSVSATTALLCCAPAVLITAVAESLPWKINDNIVVGIAAAAGIVAFHGMVVGWG